jgi:hypothetical protein
MYNGVLDVAPSGVIASGINSKQTIASITPLAKLSSKLTILLLSFLNIVPKNPPTPVPITPDMVLIITTNQKLLIFFSCDIIICKKLHFLCLL